MVPQSECEVAATALALSEHGSEPVMVLVTSNGHAPGCMIHRSQGTLRFNTDSSNEPGCGHANWDCLCVTSTETFGRLGTLPSCE